MTHDVSALKSLCKKKRRGAPLLKRTSNIPLMNAFLHTVIVTLQKTLIHLLGLYGLLSQSLCLVFQTSTDIKPFNIQWHYIDSQIKPLFVFIWRKKIIYTADGMRVSKRWENCIIFWMNCPFKNVCKKKRKCFKRIDRKDRKWENRLQISSYFCMHDVLHLD